MSSPEHLKTIWDEVTRIVITNSTSLTAGQTAWLNQLSLLSISDSFVVVSASSPLARSRAETSLQAPLTSAFAQVLSQTVTLAFTVVENTQIPVDESAAEVIPEPQATPEEEVTTVSQRSLSGQLKEENTFNAFVTGDSNRFAQAAAKSVAEAPGKGYNPLFICGPSGIGKTHLLHAIGNYALELHPDIKVCYVSSEDFTNEFISAISSGNNTEFKRKYRDFDFLLVDDVQFFKGKEQTQEEFFHTFNALYNNSKQIVLTSDRPPGQLVGLEDRMVSRFKMGLTTDIQPPRMETRVAILECMCRNKGREVDMDALLEIASNVTSNVRELEGALTRVLAFASLDNKEINVDFVQSILHTDGATRDDSSTHPDAILSTTAQMFATTVEDLRGPSRTHEMVRARQAAMYLCRELTDLSLPRIGEIFERDHTTVMHALRKVNQRMNSDRQYLNKIQEITAKLKG